jgi:hypothetical protein
VTVESTIEYDGSATEPSKKEAELSPALNDGVAVWFHEKSMIALKSPFIVKLAINPASDRVSGTTKVEPSSAGLAIRSPVVSVVIVQKGRCWNVEKSGPMPSVAKSKETMSATDDSTFAHIAASSIPPIAIVVFIRISPHHVKLGIRKHTRQTLPSN